LEVGDSHSGLICRAEVVDRAVRVFRSGGTDRPNRREAQWATIDAGEDSPLRRAYSNIASALEGVTQGELHHTWLRQGSRIQSYGTWIGERTVEGDRGGIKTHGIREVVCIRAEAECLTFGDTEGLV
jgi:hypothetical protein